MKKGKKQREKRRDVNDDPKYERPTRVEKVTYGDVQHDLVAVVKPSSTKQQEGGPGISNPAHGGATEDMLTLVKQLVTKVSKLEGQLMRTAEHPSSIQVTSKTHVRQEIQHADRSHAHQPQEDHRSGDGAQTSACDGGDVDFDDGSDGAASDTEKTQQRRHIDAKPTSGERIPINPEGARDDDENETEVYYSNGGNARMHKPARDGLQGDCGQREPIWSTTVQNWLSQIQKE